MNWIQHPVKLEGQKVKLIPLESAHFNDLAEIGKQKEIWANYSINGSDPDKLIGYLKSAVLMRATGEQYPFTIIDKAKNKIIGSTRLYNAFPEHRKLEIGWTWYDPAYWGTGHNTECKYLLLTYCFEKLHAVRVQFQTNETNLRSRAAIEKVGAKYEGLLRKERRKEDGIFRNTIMFSIIDDEWAGVKAMLEKRLAQ